MAGPAAGAYRSKSSGGASQHRLFLLPPHKRCQVPQSDGLIIAPRQELLTVGRDRHTGDVLVVGLEFSYLLAAAQFPEPDVAAGGRRGNDLAVGSHRQAEGRVI